MPSVTVWACPDLKQTQQCLITTQARGLNYHELKYPSTCHKSNNIVNIECGRIGNMYRIGELSPKYFPQRPLLLQHECLQFIVNYQHLIVPLVGEEGGG